MKIFLTGAPKFKGFDLIYARDELLPAFQRYLKISHSESDHNHSNLLASSASSSSTEPTPPRWRQIQHNADTLSQSLHGHPLEKFHNNDNIALSHGKSFNVDNLNNSNQTLSFVSDTSREESATTRTKSEPSPMFTDLSRLPAHDAIPHLPPRSMVDIIVAVVSISPLRTISVKLGQKQMNIHSLQVADETGSNFKVEFWLPIDSCESSKYPFARLLSSLKPSDVISIQSLELATWKGSTYARSINRPWGQTKIALLGSNGTLVAQMNNQVTQEKIERLTNWVNMTLGLRAQAHDSLPQDSFP